MQTNFFKKLTKSPASRAESSNYGLDILIYFLLLGLIIYNSTTIYFLSDSSPENNGKEYSTSESSINSSIEVLIKNSEKNIQHHTKGMNKALISLTGAMGVLMIILIRSGIKADKLKNKIIETEAKYQESYFIEDVTDIYKEISEEILEKPAKKYLEIDVLAYTLHQITHLFEKWQEQDKLKKITLNLYFLEPKYIISSKHIDDAWEKKLFLHLDTINKYMEENKDMLIKNEVAIRFHGYSHLPAINGIKVNDKYYISIATWNSKQQIRDSDHAKYIRILPDDRTKLAKHLKSTFNNWINKSGSNGIYNPEAIDPNNHTE